MDQLANPEPFKIERIVPDTWAAFQRLFPAFFVLAAVLYLVTLLPQPMRNPPAEISLGFGLGMMAASMAFSLVFLVFGGAVAFAVWTDQGTAKPDLGATMRMSFSRLLPMIGAAILVYLAVAGGTIAFVIPGFIFYMMFFVTIPVVVIEGVGPIEAMGRSRDLTRGHRLGIFMLMFLVGLCFAVPAIVLSFMFMDFGVSTEPSLTWNVVYGLFSAIVLLAQCAGLGVIYRNLRRSEAFAASQQAG